MKLYQSTFSPSCHKVVAVAHEVGTALELVSIDLFKGPRSPDFLAMNPNGKVPVLEDGDFVLWESNAIIGYIAQKADRLDLAPTTPRDRADVDRWLAWGMVHFEAAVRKVAFERIVKKLVGRGPADEAMVKVGTDDFARFATVLDKSLAGKGYLCGRLTIADFAVAAYAPLCESCGLDLSPYANVRVWLGKMLARDSMQRTLAAAREMQ